MDIIDKVIAREGGSKVTDDPADPGGVTKFGISQRAWPGVDVKNLTYESAKDLYIRNYWLKPRFHELPLLLAEQMLDWGVHSGPPVAVRALQKLLGVEQDGTIGADTLNAVRGLSDVGMADVARALKTQRILFLANRVVREPSQLKYLVGWLTRVLNID